uniref:Putative RNA-directed DNA polymerase, eukaryota, reverse transcriptase zinc-binding domain protein n=1 Tax=Tanacetum cinerariifolium TaxID=118510 RepID=A0A6L2LV25_TANCI|nr:putative RNA-directed DNA polymerase, eukaryota, reverse transcriptase zinc-binding domain protein [Tanacetum cinerariifolium]
MAAGHSQSDLNFRLTKKISHSIYVTNFPDSVNSRDLWNKCSVYGTVVDVFIPAKLSKASKRFAFVRFIKVFSLDRLVENLCTIWIGRYHLFANHVRFDRPLKYLGKSSNFPPLNGVQKPQAEGIINSGLKRIKDLNAIPNLQVVLADEGFEDNPSFHGMMEKVYASNNDPVHGEKINDVQLHSSDEEEEEGEMAACEVEGVAETVFGDNSVAAMKNKSTKDDHQSADPFGIYEALKKSEVELKDPSHSLSHPPGFTPLDYARRSRTSLLNKVSESLGSSGGILCMWEESFFRKEHVTVSDYFVAIYGLWIPNKAKILIVEIYAPHDPKFRRILWDYLSTLLSRWNGEVIIMGDFNEVRSSDERRGSYFNSFNARFFNNFISSSSLVDVKIEGYSFTWSHSSANKMSKLDRFLVSDGVISLFPSIPAFCLDRHLSDHRRILLCEVKLDFGPVPFQIYHSWFHFAGFDDMVVQTWGSLSFSDRNGMVRFKKKLQELKKTMRSWIKDKNIQLTCNKRDISDEMRDIDKMLEAGGASDSLIFRRNDLRCQLQDIKSREAMDSMQKSKVKWAIEGDENTNFFHVKKAFRDHYEARFKKPSLARFKINFPFPSRLSQDQVVDLERVVSRDEIRSAVWDCGENKSPGPDGFTFEFFRKYWNYIGPDFCYVVEHFFVNGLIGSVYKVVTKILANRLAMVIKDLVSDTQSAFVAKRQILDGPFILNEVLQWGTFSYAKGSILVNGSPSREFLFYCGLKQGDPLSPYLFILVMESLHLSVCKAVNDRLFNGIRLHGSLYLSHLFYADDALFIGEWSDDNLCVMVGDCMSRHKAWDDVLIKLRTRISKWKAKTLSIGGRLTLLKSVLGASPLYNLSIFKVPKGVLKELESIRNSFFKGVELSEKKITWVAWDKVLDSKKKRGLAFPRLFALETNRNISVKDKMVVALDFSFRKPVRGGVERNQFNDLAAIMDTGRRILLMSSFGVLWLRRSYVVFAVGGRLVGSIGPRFRNGWIGLQKFGFRPKLKPCLMEFSWLLGGLYGVFGIGLSSIPLLLIVR